MVSVLPISIVVPTLNRGNDILSLLHGIEELNPKPAELIIIDQTDTYPEHLKFEIENKIQNTTINVLYQKSDIKSAGSARNIGVYLSTNEHIIFIDDDVILPIDFCAKYNKCFKDNPILDAIAGRVEETNQTITYNLPIQFKDKYVGFLFRPMNYGYYLAEFADLGSCNMGIKKSVFLSLNGFDASMKRLEDSDLSFRFHKKGFKSIYNPSIYLTHKLTLTGANREITTHHLYPSFLYWKEYFYFILKNCGLIKGWPFISYYIKGSLWFKPLLIRPWKFLPAVFNLLKGAVKAKIKLIKQSRITYINI